MKKFLKTFLITMLFGVTLGFLCSLFIIFDDFLDIEEFGLLFSGLLIAIFIFVLLRNESEIIDKFKLSKSLTYNICLVVNMIIFSFIFYLMALALFDNGIIYYCTESCDWNGIQLIFIFIFAFISIVSYLFLRLAIFLRKKYKSTKKAIFIILMIIVLIIAFYLIGSLLVGFGII